MSSPMALPIPERRHAPGAAVDGADAALLGSASQEVAVELPAASVQIWNFDLFQSQRRELREDDAYRLDFCLNRRLPDAQVCYADHWPAHRLERLGKLFLLPPGHRMDVRSGVGHQHVLLCRLPARRMREWLDNEPDWSRRLEASLDIPCNSLGVLLLRLAEEVRRPGFAAALMIEALAIQLAVEIERYYRQTVDAPGAGGLAAWRLRAIEERLREDHAAPTLGELAAICRLSVRQLSRSFKAARGVSIGAHVAQSRVEAAKELLARGESVKAVAATLGFGAPSSFACAFRKATGVTPSAYRAQLGG